MQRYEYKVVPAPTKVKRVRGVKTTAGRYAHALGDVMNEEAARGWEYVRSDSMPVEEKPGLLKSAVENYYTMLVFRRPLDASSQEDDAEAATPEIAAAAPVVAPQIVAEVDGNPVEPVLNPHAGGDFPADPPMTAREPDAASETDQAVEPVGEDSPFAEPTDTDDQIIR